MKVEVTGAFLTLVLAAIVALALIAKKLRVPYPIVFVAGGVVLALIPGVPTVTLQPDLVFLLFLPALIFGDGWLTDYRAFMRYRRSIFQLAIGLVIVTSACVALAAHWLMGFPLALGFVLGAILSPTDAVATDAIAEEVSLPRPLMTILSGESLINDATGIVIFRFAVIAVATGAFSLGFAVLQFAYVSIGGVAVGLAVAWAIAKLMIWLRKKGLADELIAVSISLVTPFALYVPADAIGASGVLAALSGGIFMNRKTEQIFDAASRVAAASVWNLLFFIFNGAAFVLIGLQLRSIVRDLPLPTLATYVGWALAISAVVIVVRFVWTFLNAYGMRKLFRPAGEPDAPAPPWSWLVVLSTAGMRGIVSLAAALALPVRTSAGTPFPQRDLIVFVAFAVIVVTLVGEGLALPWLIRRLGVDAGAGDESSTAAARLRIAVVVRDHLRGLEPTFASAAEWEVAGRVQADYEQRISRFGAHVDGAEPEPESEAASHEIERRLRREACEAERQALIDLRRTGAITDDVFRTLQWEVDLAEFRLE